MPTSGFDLGDADSTVIMISVCYVSGVRLVVVGGGRGDVRWREKHMLSVKYPASALLCNYNFMCGTSGVCGVVTRVLCALDVGTSICSPQSAKLSLFNQIHSFSVTSATKKSSSSSSLIKSVLIKAF